MIFVHQGPATKGLPQTAVRPQPGSESGTPTAPTRWRTGRFLRFLIGAGLLGLPIWFFMPGLWMITSAQAVVNAHVITLTSPIEGVVTRPPPPLGRLVTPGSVLLQIDSPMVDQGKIDELKTEVASLVGRVAALKAAQREDRMLKSELLISFNNYRDSMVRRVSMNWRRRDRKRRPRSQRSASGSARRAKNRLTRRGMGSQRELNQARFTAEIASKNAARARTAVTRLSDQLDSMKKGIFTGPGRQPQRRSLFPAARSMNSPCSNLTMTRGSRRTRAGSASSSSQSRARGAAPEAVKPSAQGTDRRHRLAPFCHPRQLRRPQTSLLQIIITSTVFVDATLNEKFAGSIRPGDTVMVRLIGSRPRESGTVNYILGDDAGKRMTRWPPRRLRPSRHEVHVIVDLDRAFPGTDDFNQCFVGRRVEVRFPGLTGSVLEVGDPHHDRADPHVLERARAVCPVHASGRVLSLPRANLAQAEDLGAGAHRGHLPGGRRALPGMEALCRRSCPQTCTREREPGTCASMLSSCLLHQLFDLLPDA